MNALPPRYKRFAATLAQLKEDLLKGVVADAPTDIAVCPLCRPHITHGPMVYEGRHGGHWLQRAGGLGCQHANLPQFDPPLKTRSAVVERWNAWCNATAVAPTTIVPPRDNAAPAPAETSNGPVQEAEQYPFALEAELHPQPQMNAD